MVFVLRTAFAPGGDDSWCHTVAAEEYRVWVPSSFSDVLANIAEAADEDVVGLSPIPTVTTRGLLSGVPSMLTGKPSPKFPLPNGLQVLVERDATKVR